MTDQSLGIPIDWVPLLFSVSHRLVDGCVCVCVSVCAWAGGLAIQEKNAEKYRVTI